jgi:DNA polymerase-3 subunit beta
MIVLKATQDKVLAALQSVAGIVERRHTLPILANVLIRKTGASLQLTASDLEIQIRTTAELQGDTGDFTTTVGARKLIDILRTMPADQTVSLESNASKVILKGGKSKFTLQTLPAEDFPLVQEAANFGPMFSVPQKTLKDLLSQVAFAMAVHDIRYYLNGILFVAEGKQLSLVATDGHRLAFASATLDIEVPRQEVILPRKTVLELQRLLSDAEGAIDLQFANNQAKFSFGDMEFVTKLVEGKFPDYNRVIPKNHRNSVTLGRAGSTVLPTLSGPLTCSPIAATCRSSWVPRTRSTVPTPTSSPRSSRSPAVARSTRSTPRATPPSCVPATTRSTPSARWRWRVWASAS